MTQKKRNLTPKRKGVRAWAVVDPEGVLIPVHITPELTCYQIYDTEPYHPLYKLNTIEIEIRPLPPKKILRGKKNG